MLHSPCSCTFLADRGPWGVTMRQATEAGITPGALVSIRLLGRFLRGAGDLERLVAGPSCCRAAAAAAPKRAASHSTAQSRNSAARPPRSTSGLTCTAKPRLRCPAPTPTLAGSPNTGPTPDAPTRHCPGRWPPQARRCGWVPSTVAGTAKVMRQPGQVSSGPRTASVADFCAAGARARAQASRGAAPAGRSDRRPGRSGHASGLRRRRRTGGWRSGSRQGSRITGTFFERPSFR